MFRLGNHKKKTKEKLLVAKDNKIRPISEIVKVDMTDVNQIANAYNEIVKYYGEDKVPIDFMFNVLEGLGGIKKTKKGGKKKRFKSPRKNQH